MMQETVGLCKLEERKWSCSCCYFSSKTDHLSLYLCNSGAHISVCKFAISMHLHKDKDVLDKCELAVESETDVPDYGRLDKINIVEVFHDVYGNIKLSRDKYMVKSVDIGDKWVSSSHKR